MHHHFIRCSLGRAFQGFRRPWVLLWQELADLFQDDSSIDIAFFEYFGGPDGPGSIPPELYPAPTMASFEWYGYRGGQRIWYQIENGHSQPVQLSRECNGRDEKRNYVEQNWDMNCVRKRLCRETATDSLKEDL
mmetsp:Transcript_22714/g.38902  ORF Transcript_22714/g.38902 Transcript_22714/m.38902 type:complete len:134 (+) Transcript_22714:252-653(+)